MSQTAGKKKVLIILGHSRQGPSLCRSLAEAYQKGADSDGKEAELLDLARLQFQPLVQATNPLEQELEADLKMAQEKLLWCDHLVLVYPQWWGGSPALLKGFWDRVLTSGFAFRWVSDIKWEKLLKGRTGRMIVTMDTPPFLNALLFRDAGLKSVKRRILEFCGIQPVKITKIGPARGPKEKILAHLKKVERLGVMD